MLKFDAAQHIYRWGDTVVPSVTQIMEDVGVIDYSHIPDGIRGMALERGSLVHEITAMDDEDQLEESSVDEALMPYLLAWRKFRADSQLVMSMVEHRAYNPTFRYAGTLDRSGTIAINGANQADVLVDLKTNDAPEWTRFQTAAYAAFFESPRRFRRLAVELHKDATYRVQEFSGSDWQKDFGIFCSFLTTYRMKRECNKQLYRNQTPA